MSPAESLAQMRAKVEPVLKRHGVRKAAFYGSAARGELTPRSDVDILVELGPDQSLLDLVALKRDLEAALGRTADVVEYATLHPLLRDQILAEQVPVV